MSAAVSMSGAGSPGPRLLKMVTSEQCRAARALLGWTQEELAIRASVARRTIVEFEQGSRALQVRTRYAIAMTLENSGVVFMVDEESSGVGLKRQTEPEGPRPDPA